MSPAAGRLSVVGTGIRPGGQMTVETRALITAADRALAVVDGLAFEVLRKLNPGVESLQHCYARGRQRDESYAEMIDRMLAPLARGLHVCCAFYGHAGVFVWPAHEAIRRARAAGHAAMMYPAVSAEDCLFADLGVDPAVSGCQSYEAGDFLLYPRRIDSTSALVLWQPAALGDLTRSTFETDPRWVEALARVLGQDYPGDHPVTIYEAAVFPLDPPRIEVIALERLHEAEFSQCSTLYLQPRSAPRLCSQRLALVGVTAGDVRTGAFQMHREREPDSNPNPNPNPRGEPGTG